jgi:pimeloyl-ACP methyl ester carboxylesterase
LIEQLRGATRLAVDATKSVTEIVEAMHQTIAGGPAILGKPLEQVSRLVTAPTYTAVRGVTGLVGAALDVALQNLAQLLPQAGLERAAVLSALNGVIGDYLAATGNPLAIPFELIPRARQGRRLVVLIHGSSMNDEQWLRGGHDHGTALETDLGLTPIYARYNSGLHVSQNGRALAEAMDALIASWPEPVESIVLLGHSMGGLVARSALHLGGAWSRLPVTLVTLGTPHHGSPLERAGSWADLLLTVSRYSAPLARLGQLRSAGVTDLRYGNVIDAHWSDVDRFAHGGDLRTPVPLPEGVPAFAIAATVGTTRSDGLVPIESALGLHDDPKRAIGFAPAHTFIAEDCNHLDLLSSRVVYEKILGFLTAGAAPRPPGPAEPPGPPASAPAEKPSGR